MAGYGIQIKGSGRALMKKGGRSFPDLTGDGKVTRADVLKGRGVFATGGNVPTRPKGSRKNQSQIPPHRTEEIRKEFKKYGGSRPKGSAIEGRMKRHRERMEEKKSRTFKRGGGRANLLEEMGRIDSEKMNPNRRAEKRRVISELNRGMKKGGRVPKGYHKTKDGRVAKKGLYYYMNRAKKRGTSKPGKGSVTDKALKQSAKTAKK